MRDTAAGAPTNGVILSVDHVSVSYATREGRVVAVRDVSFQIHKGETFGLVGESGSGKSTIAMAIMNYLGVNGSAEGAVWYGGRNLLAMTTRQLRAIRGAKIAMVYQDPMTSLNPAIPVGEQIGEVLHLHRGLSREEAFRRAIEAMRQTQIADPEVNAHRYPHQLSGGMQQRVVIAMALINAPDLLILDEPTTGLDVTTEATILDLIGELRRQYQTAILFITHDLGVIAQVSDRVGVTYAGELVESGPTTRLFARPRHPYTLALMAAMPKPASVQAGSRLSSIPGRLPDLKQLPPGCVFAPRCRFAQAICYDERPRLRLAGDAQWAACHFSETLPAPSTTAELGAARVPTSASEELLAARDVKVHFSERTLWQALVRQPGSSVRAVDGLSLVLHRGETVGIVGETGSGKTTFGKMLIGLYSPLAGAFTFKGADLTRRRTREFQRQVQFVFQNPDSSLNPRKRVGDIIGRPLRLYRSLPPERIPARIGELLELVHLRPEYADRYPHELSGGEKQRVSIARAFAADPEVVIADEPLSALDVSVQASILNLLIDLRDKFGASYVFISHDLNTVRWLADRVVVMYLGNAYEIGTVAQVFEPPYHPYTEALLSAIPVADPEVKHERIRLRGPVPSPRNPPSGCKFHTRCPRKIGAICEQQAPPGREMAPGHVIYCHRTREELMNVVFARPSFSSASKAVGATPPPSAADPCEQIG